MVQDFDAILRKFFRQLSAKIEDLSQEKISAEARLVREEAAAEALQQKLEELMSNDFTPGEKINLKVKVQKLRQTLGEREQRLKAAQDLHEK